MIPYSGDYAEDATVYMAFNTFDSNDPSASVTITNLADADIKVHKDGSLTQIVTDGATVIINFDSITGNHLITIDTSAHAAYSTGSDYLVRIEGTTVDGATVNAWVGVFSIENRYSAGALRPTTAGRTLDVTATGAAGIDWANVENPTTALDLSGTDIQLVDTATALTNVINASSVVASVSGNVDGSTASVVGAVGSVTGNVGGVAGTLNTLDDLDTAQDLEHAITQDLVGNISSGSAALGQNATSVTATSVIQTLTYTATHEEDGTLHELAPSTGTLDLEYLTTLPDSAAITSVTLFCYVASNGDSVQFQFWDWTDSSFKTELTQAGSNGTTLIPLAIPALAAHTGAGANLGQVRFRVFSDGGTVATNVAIDRLRFEYSVVQSSLVFVGGAVWFDSVNGEAGTTTGIGGITRPSNTIADARTIANANNLKILHSLPGSTMTLDQAYDDFELIGVNWTLVLNTKQISDTFVQGAKTITGVATGTAPVFKDCGFGAVTLPACTMTDCGFGKSGGTFTGGSTGEYVIKYGHSLVSGAGAPPFVFTGLGASTGIHNRGWQGGSTYTLDSDCTLSHEVAEGGTTTVNSGGGDAEIRGTCAAFTLVLGASGSETVRFIGMTDTITVSGAATAAIVNLYGMSSGLTDTSSGSTVTDKTVGNVSINTECDTALADYDGPTNAEMEARTPTAAQLAYITANAATAVPVTFTTSGGGLTTAVLNLVDGSAGDATDDQYNGRLLVFDFIGDTLDGVVTDITDYAGGTTTATITAIPFAPTASHTARLV